MSCYRQISSPEILQQVLSCCFDTEVYTAVSYGEGLHGPKPCSNVSHRGGPASFLQGSVSRYLSYGHLFWYLTIREHFEDKQF